MAKIDSIQEVAVEKLIPYERNAKQHPDDQIDLLVKSIAEYGFLSPCLVDKDYRIIAGHGRVTAAKKMGLKTVPCVFIEGLTDEQYRAYILADNRLTEMGEWDMGLVEEELKTLLDEGFDTEILDMTDFGFDPIDLYAEPEDDEFVPEIPEVPETKTGDIYRLGNHTLICGDSTDEKVVAALMGDERADLFLTDPPYNVNYGGDVKDGNPMGYKVRSIMNDNFGTDEECGEKLWKPAFTNAYNFSKDDASVYCFMPQGGTHMVMMMMSATWQVKHELIWEKNSIVLSRADYNYQHEPILYGWKKTHKFYGKGEFATTSIWKFNRPTKSEEHPTMKPVPLLCEVLLNATKEGDVVLDLFGGSGSTMIACEELNRRCYMCELDPHYCDVIVRRWENHTGKKAELIVRGN